ncbi:hypothetical protein AK812_SmicGene19058 [Symbiodinium microadriaticum]|uniref:Fibronectin type-III domain-containing protein n=1 Tax=Symbiodinium microadriaticum TaxID=2951 RepID=A0A1Q9DTI3_SYMMI|nr:hypothetical protein AK812_SmicGene19058 [Symbiodinium microadriaticum]
MKKCWVWPHQVLKDMLGIYSASQSDLSCTEPPGEPEGEIKIIHAGVTAALRRAFEAEGLPKALPAKRLETTSTAESCTGRAYQVRFDDLRPGTKYEISWACHNAVGQSPFSSSLVAQN